MMGSGAVASADPLSGMIALLGDPKAAAAKLDQLRQAQIASDAARADAVKRSEEVQREVKELDATRAAIVEQERALHLSAGELKQAGEALDEQADALDARIDEHEAKVAADQAAFESGRADLAKANAALNDRLAAIDDRVKAADALSAKAEADMQAAVDAQAAADAMKADYEGRLARLLAIAKG